jgi:uncharacterized RDD family membrane protein YckC
MKLLLPMRLNKNKNPDALRRILIVIVAVGLFFCRTSLAQTQNPPAAAAKQNETAKEDAIAAQLRILAAGDARGCFVAADQTADHSPGVRIYHRNIDHGEFAGGQWFSGQPILTVLHDQRLLVYFQGGYAQSYDPGDPRTELRIPPDLEPLAAAESGGALYVLARVLQAIQFPLKSDDSSKVSLSPDVKKGDSTAPETQSGIPAPTQSTTPESRQPLVNFQPGNHLIITPAGISHWQVCHNKPLPLADWGKIAMTGLEGRLHLFGVRSGETGQETLVSGTCHRGAWSDGPKTVLGPIVCLLAVTANQRVVAAIGLAPSGSEPAVQFRLATLRDNQWSITAPLIRHEGKILECPANSIAFAAFGQNIAAFERTADKKVQWSIYSPDGSIIQPVADAIEIRGDGATAAVPWLFRQDIAVALSLLIMLIVLWRRQELVFTAEIIDQPFIIAPWWRRAAAFLLDALPADILSSLLHHELAEKFVTDRDLWERSGRGDYPPEITPLLLTFIGLLLAYFIIFETAIGTTPGKMMMGLGIRDLNGQPATRVQRLIRNLMRIIEFFPGVVPIVILVMLMTRCRQRPGDLAARTVVIFIPRDQNEIPRPNDPPNVND